MANATKPIKHWRIGPLPACHAGHASMLQPTGPWPHCPRPTKPTSADQTSILAI
jgi:hypothetical protein